MSIARMPIGSSIAQPERERAQTCTTPQETPTTLGALLALLNQSQPNGIAMLRSTAARLAEFRGTPPEILNLDGLHACSKDFRKYLEGRKYLENSVRSYINYLRILINHARNEGWSPYLSLSEDWRKVVNLAPKRKCSAVANALSRVSKGPRDITVEDVDLWAQSVQAEALSARTRKKQARKFWQLLKELGFTTYEPISMVRSRKYATDYELLPSTLRDEITKLRKWKTADFALDRPKGAQIRDVTAEAIQVAICRLYGFATNVRGLSHLGTMQQLVRKELVADYASWYINERAGSGDTLRTKLGHLETALRQHPDYKHEHFAWFRTLLDSLPSEPESERRNRKANKYIEYSVLEAVPGQLRKVLPNVPRSWRRSCEELQMAEFLIRWMLVLPWRQRNLRECRIAGPSPNLFKAKVPRHIAVDKPKWVREEELKDPDALFWQIHFVPKETKTKKPIHIFLPRPLIGLLETYLKDVRPRLIRDRDPGTLFAKKSEPLSQDGLYNLVKSVTERFTSRAVNPHLFRDILAFAWLKDHPQDYLTLSKILWHANINITLKTYGSQFDESSGACAMESWVEKRQSTETAR